LRDVAAVVPQRGGRDVDDDSIDRFLHSVRLEWLYREHLSTKEDDAAAQVGDALARAELRGIIYDVQKNRNRGD
jgi:hypothetical protein